MSIKDLDDKGFDSVKKSDRAVVKFWADWCGPCHMLMPVFEAVSGKIKDVDFFSVNVDEAEETAEEYSVMSIPTMILFEKGKEKDRIVGASNEESLIEDIKQKFAIKD